MKLYSITEDSPCPDLTFEGFESSVWFGINNLIASTQQGEGSLVRAAYEGTECYSALWAIPYTSNKVELFFLTRSGSSAITSSNPMHHHVTALTKDAKAYAAALGVSVFYLRTSRGQHSFIAKRFPEWEVSETGNLAEATLEVL
jgi:hypothetical protein